MLSTPETDTVQIIHGSQITQVACYILPVKNNYGCQNKKYFKNEMQIWLSFYSYLALLRVVTVSLEISSVTSNSNNYSFNVSKVPTV